MANFVFFSKKGKRENQEDFYGNYKDEFLVVADGMGGHAAGEVAARLAAKTAISEFKKTGDIKSSFGVANRVVFEKSQKNKEFTGMGTTMVEAVAQLNKLAVGNVGDSRCYIFSDGRLKQLTKDHRVGTHYLTRSIGHLPEVEVDVFKRELKKGDLIFLCTDGLTDVVSDNVIAKILVSKKDLKLKAQGLVEAALQFGSTDNITVGIIQK